MTGQRLHKLVVAASMVLIIIVLFIGCLLNFSAYKKSYVDSLAASYTVVALQGKRNIEYAVRYGKPLEKFYGIEAVLKSVRHSIPGVENVQIVRPDGSVLYNEHGLVEGVALPAKLSSIADFTTQKKEYVVTLFAGQYHIFIPIHNKLDQWIGTFDLSFQESVISIPMNAYLWQSLQVMGGLALLAVLLLGLAFRFIAIVGPTGQIWRTRLMGILFTVFVLLQALFSWFNITMFQDAYAIMANQNSERIAQTVATDINYVMQKGVAVQRLVGLDAYLAKVIAGSPEIEQISMVDEQGQVLYQAQKKGREGVNSVAVAQQVPLEPDQKGIVRAVQISLSPEYFFSKIKNLLLDSLTVTALSFFLMFELVVFLTLFWDIGMVQGLGTSVQSDEIYKIMRPIAFLLFLGTDMSVSFIPLQMKNLYESSAGSGVFSVLDIGAPISAEMLCAGISSVLAGIIIDRMGWRKCFFAGAFILCGGAILSALATNAVTFVVARGIVGVGYGLSWMAMRGFIVACPSVGGKAIGFSQFAAGLYAGSICGCALGAMLAERIGYAEVFFVTAGIVVLSVCFVLLFIKIKVPQRAKTPSSEGVQSKRAGGLVAFLRDANTWGLFFLITIPATICTVGFMNYFFPVYAGNIGISPANIGRAFIIYGICVIYVGPLVGRYIARHRGEKRFIMLAGVVVASALLVFALMPSWGAVIFVILMVGISDSVGNIATNTFFVNLKATRAFGEGKALATWAMIRKFGQALGPLVFASMTAAVGVQGLGLIGMAVLVLLMIFIYITRTSVGVKPSE